MGPLFTPPSIYDPKGTRGTLVLPNNTGGANWPGAAADPETGILYVSSTTIEQVLALTHDPERSEVAYIRSMEGLRLTAPPPSADAFVVPGHPLRPLGLPLFKPPWGRITAIDLNSGEHVWMIPNGDTPEDVKNHPALKGVQLPKTGRPDKAGLLVTKTLLFAGEGSGIAGASGSAGGGGIVAPCHRQDNGRDHLRVCVAREPEWAPDHVPGRGQTVHRARRRGTWGPSGAGRADRRLGGDGVSSMVLRWRETLVVWKRGQRVGYCPVEEVPSPMYVNR